MPQSFAGGNVGGFWPKIPMSNDEWDSISPSEYAHPLKRPKISRNNQPNFVPFPSMNPRMNMINPPMNRRIGHIFYKTRMCLKFLEGSCRNGEHCSFAHGTEDLREPLPNCKEIVAKNVPMGTSAIFFMKIHQNLRMRRGGLGISALDIGTTGLIMVHRSGPDQPKVNKHANVNAIADAFGFDMKPTYWKQSSVLSGIIGHYPFGERCQFAHGLYHKLFYNSEECTYISIALIY
ncbi:hypothetical protein ACSBR2_038730 [Camellia fascicularis]